MNYLNVYIKSIPLKIPMGFGVNKNVILNDLDITDRLNKKGEVSKKFCFIEMIKLDENDNPIGREEFGFFKLDSHNMSFAKDNFLSMFNKLYVLADAVYEGNEEAMEAKLAEVSKELYGKEDYDISDEANELFQFGGVTTKKLKQKEVEKKIDSLNKNIAKLFYELLKDKFGIENSPRLEILSVIDKKGYKGLPAEDMWVTTNEGTLKVEAKYLRFKAAAEKPDTPEDVGEEFSDENLEDIVEDDTADAGDINDDYDEVLEDIID